ncbi:hypothetical protein FGIG_10876 [Fasciola gigantica]|uniref:Uncharacterized protein n=1 Tax=Fasciola gigantica TaxID=46835 RepID=A0A504Z4G7_FASGI|nr:hypothetical protein FGIG_10876 [Fasciola gigantica]
MEWTVENAKLITSFPVSCTDTRPTVTSSRTAVSRYPVMHPLSVINLPSVASRTTPLPAIPPVSERAQSIPFLTSNRSGLLSPVSTMITTQLSPTSDRGVMSYWVSTQARKLLNADPNSYLEEWTLNK